jgi:cytochrome c peroxidase
MTWRVMKPCGIVLGVLLCAFVPLWVAQAQPDQSVVGKRISTTSWSAEQRARILSLGPWPPAPPTHVVSQRSTLNPLSGNAQAIAWGEQLFFDPRLSAQGKVSCATCHRPEQGYSDGRATALGVSDGTRNTMALFNLVDQRWFGWDGGADNLWAASIRPLLDAREMGSSAQHIATLLQSSQATTLQSLSEVVLKALGEGEGQSEGERQGKANAAASVRRDLAMVTVAMSIAAWIETIESPRTAFDRYRDALALTPEASVQALDKGSRHGFSPAAQRGLQLFVGKGNCWLCHGGPQFTHGEFHDTGRPFFLPKNGGVDAGRYRGIERVRQDPYNLRGRWSGDQKGTRAMLLENTVLQHRNWGEWKIPSLRNLVQTAPYMHDGSLATLREVVLHYSELNEERLHADGEALLKPLRLSSQDIDDLVAFLESLSPREPQPLRASALERRAY